MKIRFLPTAVLVTFCVILVMVGDMLLFDDTGIKNRSPDIEGVYIVKLDNSTRLEHKGGLVKHFPVYAIGVALDKHTLLLPLSPLQMVDDAEGGLFYFYYFDARLRFINLITAENLEPVILPKEKQQDNESEIYVMVFLEENVISRQKATRKEASEKAMKNTFFLFNEQGELVWICNENSCKDSETLYVFYQEYLKVIEEDGNITEILNKLKK